MSRILWSIPTWRRAEPLKQMIQRSFLPADSDGNHEMTIHLCLKRASEKTMESYANVIAWIESIGIDLRVDEIDNYGWDFVAYAMTCSQYRDFDYYVFAIDDVYILGDNWINKWLDSEISDNPHAILANCKPDLPQPGMEEYPELCHCLFPMFLSRYLIESIWNWSIPYDKNLTDWRQGGDGPGTKGYTVINIERPFKESIVKFENETRNRIIMVPPTSIGAKIHPIGQICDNYDDPRINSQRPVFQHPEFYGLDSPDDWID